MYFIMLILKKSVLLLQPLLLQIIIEEVELLFARSIVSLALSLLDDSLHQAKCVLLARMRTVSPEVG